MYNPSDTIIYLTKPVLNISAFSLEFPLKIKSAEYQLKLLMTMNIFSITISTINYFL
jgi:hypothetical protein